MAVAAAAAGPVAAHLEEMHHAGARQSNDSAHVLQARRVVQKDAVTGSTIHEVAQLGTEAPSG